MLLFSFPQELIDMIIDEAASSESKLPSKPPSKPDQDSRTHTLIALSRVSRAFRERAHDHLFACIEFDGSPRATKAAARLLSLLKNDVQVDHHPSHINTDTAAGAKLASRITTLSCGIPQHNHLVLLYLPILKKLFTGSAGLKPCSLSLHFFYSPSWSSLPPTVAQDLFHVCHRPRLTSLSLTKLYDIPRNFFKLQHSHIGVKRLSLQSVSVSDSESLLLPESFFAIGMIPGPGRYGEPAVSLEYLHIQNEASVLSLLTIPSATLEGLGVHPPLPGPTSIALFSHLKELDYSFPFNTVNSTIPSTALEEILIGCKGHLEVLQTSFAKLGAAKPLIRLPNLPNLHTLRINALGLEASTLFDLTDLLSNFTSNQRFPNLHTIELKFNLSYSWLSHGDADVIRALYLLGSVALDELFVTQQEEFARVRKLTLHCCSSGLHAPFLLSHMPGVLRRPEEYEPLVMSQFPRIASRENLAFSVHVHHEKTRMLN
ncbi:hypothetical protein CPC08DRAFT_531683 [Agrocybe pediades]|nr:hypothetical protein CPC08DRAFT_531683 [Agrocybe pediades]